MRAQGVAAILIASLTGLHPYPVRASPSPAEEAGPEPVAEGSATETPSDTETSGAAPEDLAPAEAQRHFIEGQALYEEGRYDEAAGEFRRSYAAFPTATALYNMALAEERAGDVVAAVRSYERYLLEDSLTQERRSEVEGVLQQLRGRVGEIRLNLADGVKLREVRVDGRVVPESDFPILVLPGDVEVELIGAGAGEQRARRYAVAGGERLQIEVLPFEPERGPEVPGPTPAPPAGGEARRPDQAERRARIVRAAFWSGLAVTGAGGVAVGVLGGLARRAERDFNREKCDEVCTDPDAQPPRLGLKDRANRLALATNVAIGVTAAIGLTTAILGAVTFKKRPRGKAATRLAPTPGGLSFHF